MLPPSSAGGWLGGIGIAGRNILDAMDNFASNLLLPANGILIAVFVGWVWSARDACNASGLGSRLAAGWHVVIRYVAPLLVGVVLLPVGAALGHGGPYPTQVAQLVPGALTVDEVVG